MSQPIVPLTVPQSRRFEKKSRNILIFHISLFPFYIILSKFQKNNSFFRWNI